MGILRGIRRLCEGRIWDAIEEATAPHPCAYCGKSIPHVLGSSEGVQVCTRCAAQIDLVRRSRIDIRVDLDDG